MNNDNIGWADEPFYRLGEERLNYGEIKDCGQQYVSDGIGDDYQWRELGPGFTIQQTWTGNTITGCPMFGGHKTVFISAQTGSGKNYFIANELIEYYKKRNKGKLEKGGNQEKILILSNRIALSFQSKNDLIERLNLKRKFEKFTNKGKIEEHDFGFVTVLQYQSLLGAKSSLDINSYKYVICDECHFFVTDAMFNPETYPILSTIIGTFENAIKIYMSATIEDSAGFIIRTDQEIWGKIASSQAHIHAPGSRIREEFVRRPLEELPPYFPPKEIFRFYKFDVNYEYLNIMYFTENEEIYREIVDNNEKWLVFIDNKNECNRFAAELSAVYNEDDYSEDEDNEISVDTPTLNVRRGRKKADYNEERIKVISAKSKKDEGYQDILENETFDQDVLISTSVIDNGVNLRNVENIVITSMDRAKCLQMVGRVRVDRSKGEMVNLYIRRITKKQVEKQVDQLKRQYAAYKKYDVAYGDAAVSPDAKLKGKREFLEKYYNGKVWDFEDAKYWFYREFDDPDKLLFNIIAREVCNQTLPKYKSLLARIEEDEKGGIQDFLEHQIGWFEGHCYEIDNDVTVAKTNPKKAKFMIFLQKRKGSPMPKEEQAVFRKEFTDLYVDAYGRRPKDNLSQTKETGYGINIINQVLLNGAFSMKIVTDSSDKEKGTVWTLC